MKSSSRSMSKALVAGSFLLTLMLPACRPDDQRTESLDVEAGQRTRAELPAPVVAQLDSGSAAFRVDDHQEALRHYREAARLGPDVAAAWFGVYMAQKALGNAQGADSALARVQELAPGATILHGDTTGGGGS